MDEYYQMLIEFGRQWDAQRNIERTESELDGYPIGYYCESDQSHPLRVHDDRATGGYNPEDWGQ